MKFYNTLFASAAAGALLAGGALAADLPVRSAAPAPMVYAAPIFTWSGFYVGVNAGYGGDRFSTRTEAYICGDGCQDYYDTRKIRSSGGFAGAQIGYNWQFANRMVLGLEADYQFSGIKGDGRTFGYLESDGYGRTYGAEGYLSSKVSSFGTVRARLGYGFDRSLLYVTGGYAFGRVKTSGYLDLYSGYSSESTSFSRSNNMSGFTVGAGLEYMLTQNLSFKTEYLYVDLGKKSVGTYDTGKSGATSRVDARFHLVRAGLNYRFGGAASAPVLARY